MKAMKKEKLFTRNFTLLILGQVSSLTGNYTLKFALSMYVLEQTGSASIFAGMLSAALLPPFCSRPSAESLQTGPTANTSWWRWTRFLDWWCWRRGSCCRWGGSFG